MSYADDVRADLDVGNNLRNIRRADAKGTIAVLPGEALELMKLAVNPFG